MRIGHIGKQTGTQQLSPLSEMEEKLKCVSIHLYIQGPVVQSVVSLMSSLSVISLTVSADSIYSILIFFAEKM